MTVRLNADATERLDATFAARAAASREPRIPLDDAVRDPMTSLDLEDLGLEVDIPAEQITALLEERAQATTQVLATVDRLTADLTVFRPQVPASLPAAVSGTLVNPDGSPAGQVRVRALEPTGVATAGDSSTFSLVLPWPNPEALTDGRGAFRLALPPRPLPDAGLVLLVVGGNRAVEVALRRTDLVAGDGALGVLPLDVVVSPLPRSVLSQLGDVVRPTSDEDVLDNPELFAEPAPVITLGDADCAVSFRSNSGVIDRFGYSMLVRLVGADPERTAPRDPGGPRRQALPALGLLRGPDAVRPRAPPHRRDGGPRVVGARGPRARRVTDRRGGVPRRRAARPALGPQGGDARDRLRREDAPAVDPERDVARRPRVLPAAGSG